MFHFRSKPGDLCVASPTGSGKTLSYVLPVLQAIGAVRIPTIEAVILVPSIELAEQVNTVNIIRITYW